MESKRFIFIDLWVDINSPKLTQISAPNQFRISSDSVLYICQAMKQATAIFFLLIYLSAATELHQLVRLPVLIEHFKEHKNLNGSLGLLDFIVLHYVNSEHANAEDQHELPFNSNDCIAVALSLVILPDISSEPPANAVSDIQAPMLYPDLVFASCIHFSIWQPPRA